MSYPLRPRVDDQRFRRPRNFWVRRCSSYFRRLPDFLIIGEMKSGTTSLFHYIQRHPLVAPPLRKEIHYFSIGHDKGLGWYRSHFPVAAKLPTGSLTGEGCPDYLFAPGADKRIRQVLPDVRMIVLLRNPVERAISHYYHEVSMGREYLPIMEALEAEDDRMSGALVSDPEGMETYLHASYKARGRYADQLERYFEIFGKDRLLILGNNQLLRNPQKTVGEAFTFLGLPPRIAEESYPRKNSGAKSEVPKEVFTYLNNYFEPHNRRLFNLLGRELDW